MSVVNRFNVNREQVLLDTGIYDVSSHNNGAVFESLSSLLSHVDLSTLIPPSIRCGGMSIRFIQGSELNSDNNYVQYTLMATTWSTNVSDWKSFANEMDVALKYNGIKSSSDYSDMNNVPIGTITTFAGTIGIEHAPTTSIGGTLICTSNVSTVGGGALQIFISQYNDTNGSTMYYRLYWGDGSGWSDWVALARSSAVPNIDTLLSSSGRIINNPERCIPPYDDINTVPVNTMVTYVISDTMDVANKPPFNSFTLQTFNHTNRHIGGIVQIAYRIDGPFGIAYRAKYGSGEGTFNSWKSFTNEKDIALKYNGINSSSNYSDFDDIPVGTITTFAGTTGIEHTPITSIGGTLICTSNASTVGGGALQIFISQHNDNGGCHIYYRLYWGDGTGWSEWKIVVNRDEVNGLVNGLVSQKQDIAYNTISSFLKIGVIGDSYASGLIYPNYPSSTVGVEAWSISWIQQLARINGVTGVNYSKSGVTCKSWWSSPICRAKLEADNPCDLYYLVLGINDSAEDRDGQTLGEPEDMDYTGENAPNTFYYNYAQIVRCVQAKAPRAKLIFVEMASNTGKREQYNTAIRNIANHFSIPCMAEYNDSFFKTSYYTSHLISGHPTTQVYGGMAKAIERMTQKCMYENVEYFNTIIPTDIL